MKETLELEDYEEEGAIPVSAFKEAFQTLDIQIEDDLLAFIFFVVYQKSESLDKMRYAVLFDLIDGKLPGLNATSSEGGRKRPESSSPEKLKARNLEKFAGVQALQQKPSDAELAQKAASKQKGKGDTEDNYEEEFEQLLDKDDEEGEYADEALGKMEEQVNKEIAMINQQEDKEEYEENEY